MERENDVQTDPQNFSGRRLLRLVSWLKSIKRVFMRFAWQKIQDFHYAEEIMQDTFLRAYKKLPTLKNPNQFAGWLQCYRRSALH